MHKFLESSTAGLSPVSFILRELRHGSKTTIKPCTTINISSKRNSRSHDTSLINRWYATTKRNNFICQNFCSNHPINSGSEAITGTIPWKGRGIEVGQYAEYHKKISQRDVEKFADLIGDYNPVHLPPIHLNDSKCVQYGTNSKLHSDQSSNQAPIVHGIFLSSLFSAIFGTLVPGAIYRAQSLKFSNAVYVGEKVIGRVVVRGLKKIMRRGNGVLCTCDTSVLTVRNDKEIICVSGEAQVWLPHATIAGNI